MNFSPAILAVLLLALVSGPGFAQSSPSATDAPDAEQATEPTPDPAESGAATPGPAAGSAGESQPGEAPSATAVQAPASSPGRPGLRPPPVPAEEPGPVGSAGDSAGNPANDGDPGLVRRLDAPREPSGDGPGLRPPQSCVNPPSESSPFGWTRDRMFDFVCTSGRWLDSKFGDEPFAEAEQKIRGYLELTGERREGASFRFKPKFRFRLDLPNVKRRLSLSFEREDETRLREGTSGPALWGGETRSVQSDDTTTVSLIFEAKRALDRVLDFRVGLRGSRGKPNPYVRALYQRDYGQSEEGGWNFSQSLFYRHIEGLGETTIFSYHYYLSPPWLFRWTNIGTATQQSGGLQLQTSFELWHAIDAKRAVRTEILWQGGSVAPGHYENYGYRVTYRQALGRPWLIGQLYSGYDFPLDETLARHPVFYLGAGIEIHFGRQAPGV